MWMESKERRRRRQKKNYVCNKMSVGDQECNFKQKTKKLCVRDAD